VVAVTGVLNGSTNFILNQTADGCGFAEAVRIAGELGFTERDPYLDLAGIDAAEKLVLLAAQCDWEIPVQDVMREELVAHRVDQHDPAGNTVLRQMARLWLEDGQPRASVTVEAVARNSNWGQLRGSANQLTITTASGRQIGISGTGAGRWPTTTSVMGDLLQLARYQRRHRYPEVEAASCTEAAPILTI
jgi:homoserine dehydrogenase